MTDTGYKGVGCLWVMMTATCMFIFLVFLVAKLFGSQMHWFVVFIPLIVACAIGLFIVMFLVIVAVLEAKDKKRRL